MIQLSSTVLTFYHLLMATSHYSVHHSCCSRYLCLIWLSGWPTTTAEPSFPHRLGRSSWDRSGVERPKAAAAGRAPLSPDPLAAVTDRSGADETWLYISRCGSALPWALAFHSLSSGYWCRCCGRRRKTPALPPPSPPSGRASLSTCCWLVKKYMVESRQMFTLPWMPNLFSYIPQLV